MLVAQMLAISDALAQQRRVSPAGSAVCSPIHWVVLRRVRITTAASLAHGKDTAHGGAVSSVAGSSCPRSDCQGGSKHSRHHERGRLRCHDLNVDLR